jgi:hypothetical protein
MSSWLRMKDKVAKDSNVLLKWIKNLNQTDHWRVLDR